MGTSEYSFLPSLPAARNSLERMYGLMTGPLCGWPTDRVEFLADERGPGDLPDRLITSFEDTADVALFYYVGHGQIDMANQLCLALAGSRTEANRRATTSLPFEAIRRAMLDSPAAIKIVILDCCFAGLASLPGNSLAPSPDNMLDRTAGSGAYTMAATGAYSPAWYDTTPDAVRPQTFFTRYLVDLVESGIPGQPSRLRLHPLFVCLRDRLAYDKHPVPVERSVDDARDFVFAHNAAPPEIQRDLDREVAELSRRLAEAEARKQAPRTETAEQVRTSRAESVLGELPETRWRAYPKDDVARWVYAVDNPAWDSTALPGELASTPMFRTVFGGYRRDKVEALARTFVKVSPDLLMRPCADGRPSEYSTGLLDILSRTPNVRTELDVGYLQLLRERCRVPETDRVAAAVQVGVKANYAGWIVVTDWGFRFHNGKSGLAVRHSDLDSVAISVFESWNDVGDYSALRSDLCVHYRDDLLCIGGAPADIKLHVEICRALCRINCLNASVRGISCTDRQRFWICKVDAFERREKRSLHELHHE